MEYTRLLYPWDSLGKNNRMNCHDLLQAVFPTQGSNQPILHPLPCQVGPLPLGPPGKPLGSVYLVIKQDTMCTSIPYIILITYTPVTNVCLFVCCMQFPYYEKSISQKMYITCFLGSLFEQCEIPFVIYERSSVLE